MRNEALGGWKQCVMHIVDCRPVDGDLLSAEFRGKEGLHEVCIRLMTGYETLNPLTLNISFIS